MVTSEGVSAYTGRIISEHGLDVSLADTPLLQGDVVELGEDVKLSVGAHSSANVLDAALLRALSPAMQVERGIAAQTASTLEYPEVLNDIGNPRIWPSDITGTASGAGWHLSGDRVRSILTPRNMSTGLLGDIALQAVLPDGVPKPKDYFKPETDPTHPGVALSGLAFVVVGQYRGNAVAGTIGMQVRRDVQLGNKPYLSGGAHRVARWMEDASSAAAAIRRIVADREAYWAKHPKLSAWEVSRRKH